MKLGQKALSSYAKMGQKSVHSAAKFGQKAAPYLQKAAPLAALAFAPEVAIPMELAAMAAPKIFNTIEKVTRK